MPWIQVPSTLLIYEFLKLGRKAKNHFRCNRSVVMQIKDTKAAGHGRSQWQVSSICNISLMSSSINHVEITTLN